MGCFFFQQYYLQQFTAAIAAVIMLLACIFPERIACAAFPGRFLHVIFYRDVRRISMAISFLSGFLSHRRVVIVISFPGLSSPDASLCLLRIPYYSFSRHWYREVKVACSNVRWFFFLGFCFRSGSGILVYIIS